MPTRMLSEREAALVRDNAASGTADRRGLYVWGRYVLTLGPFSVERAIQRREARLPALLHRTKRPRCRVCDRLIEPGDVLLLWREFIEVEGTSYTRQHSGAIHEVCPR